MSVQVYNHSSKVDVFVLDDGTIVIRPKAPEPVLLYIEEVRPEDLIIWVDRRSEKEECNYSDGEMMQIPEFHEGVIRVCPALEIPEC